MSLRRFASPIVALAVLGLCSAVRADGDSGARVDDAGFVGRYHEGLSEAGRSAILVLGGSEGGFPDELAAPFMRAGHPVLALAYFKGPGLPPELERVPIESAVSALDWMQRQPGAAEDGVIVVGWSKGAELALVLSAHDPRVRGVVAIAPSHVMWAGILSDWTKTPAASWTLRGDDLPSVPFDASGGVDSLRGLYEHSLQQAAAVEAATIPAERSRADLLLLSGGKDEIWPAGTMAEAVCARAASRPPPLRCDHRHYPTLGHLLDGAWSTAGHDAAEAIARFIDAPRAAPSPRPSRPAPAGR